MLVESSYLRFFGKTMRIGTLDDDLTSFEMHFVSLRVVWGLRLFGPPFVSLKFMFFRPFDIIVQN